MDCCRSAPDPEFIIELNCLIFIFHCTFSSLIAYEYWINSPAFISFHSPHAGLYVVWRPGEVLRGGHFLITVSVPCPAAWPLVLTMLTSNLKNLWRHYAEGKAFNQGEYTSNSFLFLFPIEIWLAKILKATSQWLTLWTTRILWKQCTSMSKLLSYRCYIILPTH